ncbi:MAG: response regulator [Bacteroidetes bacterium]|nr:response regulator [Bacteroidota bacterium]
MTKSLPLKSLVLYADDDRDDIELVKEAFKEYAHTVDLKTFADGEELMRYVNSHIPAEPLPCLIILDINMPRMNGKEVLRNLKQIPGYKDIPVVLFTTSTLPSEKAFAKSFDAGFITKPLHYSQIHQLVDEMIAHCPEDVRKTIKRLKG